MKKHLLFIFAALLPLLASAQTEVEIDGIWYNLVSKAKLAEVKSSGGTKYSGTITIPATVTYEGEAYSVTSIGSSAFSGCSSLTAVHIPASVTSIGSSAFYGCSSLTAVHISSIEAWCKITFENYESNPLYHAHNLYLNGELVTNLVIPDGVTSIGNYAFLDCSSLTAITIPEGVTSIGDYAFRDCSSLTDIVVAEGNQKYDSRGGCKAIIETASNTLISGCSTTIIPEGVTSIGGSAFTGCTSLTAITIPEGVKSIGTKAFYGCYKLKIITSYATVPPTCGANALYGIDERHCMLRVPIGYAAAYQAADQWKEFFFVEDVVEVDTNIEHSESTIQDSQSIYDLSGRKIVVDDLSELQKGIYIINGRRVLVK